jgi:hypothetical protein
MEEIQSVDSLSAFVFTSAKQAYPAFFLIDRIHYSTLDVHFFVDPIYETLHYVSPMIRLDAGGRAALDGSLPSISGPYCRYTFCRAMAALVKVSTWTST